VRRAGNPRDVVSQAHPQPGEGHNGSRPFFPPQPTPRINDRGMSVDFGSADISRMSMVVGWAYGREDPLSVHPSTPDVLEEHVGAIARLGTAHVWRAKRLRIEGPVTIPARLFPQIRDLASWCCSGRRPACRWPWRPDSTPGSWR